MIGCSSVEADFFCLTREEPMKSNTIIIIFLAFVGMSNGQEQFKTGNSWNYFYSDTTIGNQAQCFGNPVGWGISIKILSAVSKIDGSIDFTAEIKDTIETRLPRDISIDTAEYLYKNNSISSINHTSPDSFASNEYIGYLIVPNVLIDSVGQYQFSNIPYTVLEKEIIGTSFGGGAAAYYYYLQNIGILYNYTFSTTSQHGTSCYTMQSYSLKAFNNVSINSDSLFQYLQTPVKNSFQVNQFLSFPIISIKKDGNRIISRSIKFVGTAQIEILDLQGRKLISKDLVFSHQNEMAVFSINTLPEGLYIVNAYTKGTAKRIVSTKIIH
jgi:hypothetical protein